MSASLIPRQENDRNPAAERQRPQEADQIESRAKHCRQYLHSACSRSFVENRRWQVKGIEINRKMLSEMAINDAVAFTALCDLAKNA